jgi:hypothetical protein
VWAAFRECDPDEPASEATDTIEWLGGRRPNVFAEFVAEEHVGFAA